MKDEININGLTVRSVNERTLAEMACENLTSLLKERAEIILNDYKGSKDHFNEANIRHVEREIEGTNFDLLKNLGLKIYIAESTKTCFYYSFHSIDDLYLKTYHCIKENKSFKLTVLPLTKKDKDFRISYLWQEYKNGHLKREEIQKELQGIEIV